MSTKTKFTLFLTLFTAVLASVAAMIFLGEPAMASSLPLSSGMPPVEGVGLGYLAAALATGLSSLAAGYAVAHVGASAIGAITEKPELLGRMLILVGLAEGIAIYGLIISILILNRLG